MADTAEAAEPKPKSRKLLFVIIIASVVLAAGGAGGYFYFKKAAESKAKAESAKKALKEKSDEEALAAKEAGGEKNEKGDGAINAGLKIDLPDDKGVRKVIALEPFVVNLVDPSEPRYLRMTISIGIGETKEEKTDPLLTTRVRNAILAVLTTKSSTEVLTQEGKAILRKELLKAARAAVDEPKIEAIYITDFIIQM